MLFKFAFQTTPDAKSFLPTHHRSTLFNGISIFSLNLFLFFVVSEVLSLLFICFLPFPSYSFLNRSTTLITQARSICISFSLLNISPL